MVEYDMQRRQQHMSFLEMLDVLNEHLIEKGEEPIAFDHDCREGICGSCGFMINGVAHGRCPAATVCQLHMRHFKDGDELYLEPWRARPFRSLRIWPWIAPPLTASSRPADSSPCQPAALPTATRFPSQRQCRSRHGRRGLYRLRGLCGCLSERCRRVCSPEQRSRISICCLRDSREGPPRVGHGGADERGVFGNCTNIGECEAVCPKPIRLEVIARMNRDYLKASWSNRREPLKND